METIDKSFRMTGLVVSTAMAAALLSGCTTNAAPQANISASAAVEAMAEGRHDRAIRHAEAAVLAEPRSAAYRAMLGKTYLDAGRFAAAQTSFDDAMELGDNSPRTALSLALTLTAQAKYSEAAALLSDWEGQIATADLGLAFALAGQPERGIHLLTNAIRGGENTVKVRQNLAYAYASAGRWREARLTASQDIPADAVGARMAHWAELSGPLAYQQRVAGLLGVPSGVRDAGQPTQLALANHPSIEHLAAHATTQVAALDAPAAVQADQDNVPLVQAPAVQAPVVQAAAQPHAPASTAPMSFAARGSELPSVGAPTAPTSRYEAPSSSSANFAEAFSAPVSAAPVRQDAQRLTAAPAPRVSGPVAGPVAGRVSGNAPAQAAPRSAPAMAEQSPRGSSAPLAFRSAASTVPTDGHLVQLGSFSSEQGAQRAWGIYVSRYPELANHEMVITQAMVRGKRYFRVSAGGFDRNASRSMCSSVNASSSDGCISWAAATPLPGAIDTGVQLARR